MKSCDSILFRAAFVKECTFLGGDLRPLAIQQNVNSLKSMGQNTALHSR